MRLARATAIPPCLDSGLLLRLGLVRRGLRLGYVLRHVHLLSALQKSDGGLNHQSSRQCHESGRHRRCGTALLELKNSSGRLFLAAAEFPDAIPHCATVLEFEPHLSAKQLLTTQTFRDLFRHELVKGTEGMSVRDISLMFTDLKGSTELYERIGDLNAFALVQEHFERLTAVAVSHNGAIIKTLGDAVMAAFMTPVDGVQAALAMQAEIVRFNEARGERDLILKIGLHRGAVIAVTLNERLDYFGQNVNIAARVPRVEKSALRAKCTKLRA